MIKLRILQPVTLTQKTIFDKLAETTYSLWLRYVGKVALYGFI